MQYVNQTGLFTNEDDYLVSCVLHVLGVACEPFSSAAASIASCCSNMAVSDDLAPVEEEEVVPVTLSSSLRGRRPAFRERLADLEPSFMDALRINGFRSILLLL